MAKLLATISNLASLGKNYFNFSGSKIGDLVIDATYASDINLSNTITDHPIEGSYATDHIYNNATTVNLQCAILASPIGILATANAVIDIFSGNIVENIKNKYNF